MVLVYPTIDAAQAARLQAEAAEQPLGKQFSLHSDAGPT
jgi:hypothetical protein